MAAVTTLLEPGRQKSRSFMAAYDKLRPTNLRLPRQYMALPTVLTTHRAQSKRSKHVWTHFSSETDWQSAINEEVAEGSTRETPQRSNHDSDSCLDSAPCLSNSTSTTTPSRHSSATSLGSESSQWQDTAQEEATLAAQSNTDGTLNHEATPASVDRLRLAAQCGPQHVSDNESSSAPSACLSNRSSLWSCPVRAAPQAPDSDVATHSQNSSTTNSWEIPCRSIAAGELIFDHMTWDSGSDTPDHRAKGKARLTSIRDISWELIEEQDVRALCTAYDEPYDYVPSVKHVTMGAAASGYYNDETQIAASSNQTNSNTFDMARAKQQSASAVQHNISKKRPLPTIPTRQSERLREKQRRKLEDYELRLQANNKRIEQQLQKLRDEDAARAEELEAHQIKELRRQERKDYLAAIALQETLDQEDTEACRVAEELARSRECTVCGDTKDKDTFPPRCATTKCQHPSQICSDCLDSWIASALEDNGIDGIKCPECPEKLAYEDVQIVASAATFEAYDKATMTNVLSALPEFAWCLDPKCKSGQLNIDNSNYMECASCSYKQCLQHKVAWHVGETCDAYEHRTSGAKAREEEEKTLAMLDSISKVCPGPNCGWRIQKTDGCDHVTCRKCRFEFCWQCLASHAEIKKTGNTAHKRECKFHSSNLDLAWPFNRH